MCSSTIFSTILLLHTFICTSWFLALVLVNGAKFKVVNNCTQTIWPAMSGSPSLGSTGFELLAGSNRVLQAPKRWTGRFWGRTGCTFNARGRGSCRTGDCGSGQIECDGTAITAITLAEFAVDSFNSMDFYNISLVQGFNLPMMIEPSGVSGERCLSIGCTEDVNQLCPAELRTENGDACRHACDVFRSSACGPTYYSQLFKNACPMAVSYPTDNADTTFTCSAGDYVITFCPTPFSQQNAECREPFQCGGISDIGYPFWGANRPEICGFPGFGLLNCWGDAPLLNIDSRSYRVLGINYTSQTLIVARQDLWNNACPSVLYNTTFDPKLFSFPQNYSYENVILYYDCKANQPQATTSRALHSGLPNHANQFTCKGNRTETINFFSAGNASVIGSNVTCNNSLSVPVNQYAALALSSNSASVNDLQDALANGFSIQWLNSVACQGCFRLGGVCVQNPDSALINCEGPPTEGVPPVVSDAWDPLYHTDPGGGESRQSTIEKVLIGMAVTVAIAAAFIIFYLRRRRRFKRLRNIVNQENENDENFLLNNESLGPRRYKHSQIKEITKSFSNKLGQGGYGSVYKGTLRDGEFVAVKLLTETKSNGEDFINEVASISKTSHVNIVKLLGFCSERNKRALVYEFMPNKSLDKFISNNGSLETNCQLDWETMYKIVVGVARGLEYLHMGCNPRIVHFDIKPQNILLDDEFCPKISDFGLAKLCKKKQSILSMVGARGTVGYIAPEVFSRNFGGVSHKSDVYSYGMMVLEMAGARNIIGLGSTKSSENYFPDKIYELAILHETQNLEAIASEEEEQATRKMFLVGFWCIQTIPSDRPSMSKVVEMLEGSLESIQIPPKPFLFTPTSLEQELSSSASGDVEIESSTER